MNRLCGFTLILALAAFVPRPVLAGDDYEPQTSEEDGKDKKEAEQKPKKGETGVALDWDEETGSDEAAPYARRKPYTRRCKEYDENEEQRAARLKRVEYAASHLGGEHTRRAWKDLLKLGLEGCDEVAAWLGEGGPAGLAADHGDASTELVLYGRRSHVQAGAEWLGDPDPGVAKGIARALRRRLVALDETVLKYLVTHFEADDRSVDSTTLLGILVGYYTETYTYTTYVYSNGTSIPVVNSYTVWYYASGPPPEAHVETLRELLDGAGNKWADEVAQTLRARAVYKGGVGQERWAPLLLELVRDRERAIEVVDKAAHALGWMQPKGSKEIALTLLEDEDPLAQMAYLKGLRSRAKKGYGDRNTVWLMQQFVEAEDRGVSKAATKWSNVWGRKLSR